MQKWAPVGALLLAAIGSARIVSTYQVFNHTIDEPDTIAPGMEYLSIGKYLYEDTHPPLGRVFAAIGPYLAGERFHPGPNSYFEGYRILGHAAHYDRVLALARIGNLPFFWIGCLVVYLWAARIRGPWAALVAVLVYTTIPPILAHAGLATTDMAVGVMTPAAALGCLWWAEVPDRRRSLAFGALLALACVSKFSALLFLPAGLLAMWACGRGAPQPCHWRSLPLVIGAAALVVWAVYGFSFARVEFLYLRLPAPRFFSGIHSVYVHNRGGHPAYLLGRRSPNGFWYYFPVVLALKTPLALLVLAGAAAVWAIRAGGGPRTTSAPLAFSAAILLVAMTGHIDLGVRYLLPVYAGLAVAAGCLAVTVRGVAARLAVAALIAWQVLSGALQHPDYLAYTNEIASRHPERFLADSDLDWGQDMKRLGDFLASRGITHLTYSPFNRTYLWAGHPLPPLDAGETDHPSPGWNAVSITVWKVFGYPRWADSAGDPDARIGRSILLWYVK
jgi:MFS family permease